MGIKKPFVQFGKTISEVSIAQKADSR